MKILLTGATGFIGSNLINYLNETDDDNEWYLLTSRRIEGYRCILHNNYTYTTQNILDVGANNLDVAIMLGGYIEKPGDDKGCNVRNHTSSLINVKYLLEHLTEIPKKIIFCSSIAVYGFDQVLPWQDDAPIIKYTEKSDTGKNLTRTYALVKLLQERLIKEWSKEKKCTSQILRIGTVYGPERDFYNFLGTCLRCLKNRVTMSMYAPLNQMWNFVYVRDIARWIRRACNDLEEDRTINLVSDNNYTTQQVLNTIKQVWPEFDYIIDSSRGYTGQHKAFDSSLRRNILGNEEYNLLKGLKEIKERGL